VQSPEQILKGSKGASYVRFLNSLSKIIMPAIKRSYLVVIILFDGA